MRLIKLSILSFFVLAPFTVLAQQTGVRLSIGPFYRNFDDIEFKGTPSFPPIGTSNFANATDPAPANGYGIQQYTSLPSLAPVGQVAVDYVDGGGSSKNGVDTSDRWGPTIGIEMDIVDNIDSIVSFVGNFSFFSVQGGGNSPASGAFSVLHDLDANGVLQPVLALDEAQFDPQKNASGANAFIDNDFDLELYVLDIGLKSKFTYSDPFFISIAAGPSLNIGDANSEQASRGTWTSQDPSDSGQLAGNQSSRKSDVDFIFGLYAAVEAEYRLNESISIALGWRYDYVSQEVGTSQAELDLETHGGYAKLLFDF